MQSKVEIITELFTSDATVHHLSIINDNFGMCPTNSATCVFLPTSACAYENLTVKAHLLTCHVKSSDNSILWLLTLMLHFTCPRYLPVPAGTALGIYVQEYLHLSTVTRVVKSYLETRPKEGRLGRSDKEKMRGLAAEYMIMNMGIWLKNLFGLEDTETNCLMVFNPVLYTSWANSLEKKGSVIAGFHLIRLHVTVCWTYCDKEGVAVG